MGRIIGSMVFTLILSGLSVANAGICGSRTDDPTNANWIDVEDGPAAQQELARSVGMLAHAPGDGFCSGAMITDDLFLTAGHCLSFCDFAEEVCADSGVQFNYQRDGGRLPRESEMPFFDCAEVLECHYGDGYDYAVIRLAGSPGREFGHLDVDLRPPVIWEPLTEIHHALYEPKRISKGWVTPGSTDNWLTYHVDDAGGSSGAPILDRDGEIIGIVSTSGCDDSIGRPNYGARADAAIQSWLGQIDIEPDPYRVYFCLDEDSRGNCTQWDLSTVFSRTNWRCKGDTTNCTVYAISDKLSVWGASQVYAMVDVGDDDAVVAWDAYYWDIDGYYVDWNQNASTRVFRGSGHNIMWEKTDQDVPRGAWNYPMQTPVARFDFSFSVGGLDFAKSVELWTNVLY